MQKLPEAWQQLYDQWPPKVTRKIIAATEIIAVSTQANNDCAGRGVPNRVTVGKKVFYPKADAILWLMAYCGEAPSQCTEVSL